MFLESINFGFHSYKIVGKLPILLTTLAVAGITQWIRLRLPATQGSSPKHTIYAFIIYSICAIFVM